MCVCLRWGVGWGGGGELIKSGKLRGPSNIEGAPQSGRSKVLLPESCITHSQRGNWAPPYLLKRKLQKQRASGEIIRKSSPKTKNQHKSSLLSFTDWPPTLEVLKDRHVHSAGKDILQMLVKSWKFCLHLLPPWSTWKIFIIIFLIIACFQ